MDRRLRGCVSRRAGVPETPARSQRAQGARLWAQARWPAGERALSEDDRFLSRWSQRKRLAAEEARKAAEATPAPAEPAAEEEPFDLSLLPDLESLTPETDISLFMQKGVPDELRNLALRKMWALDPAIRNY